MAIVLTLPDGSQRSYDNPITGKQLAEDIGPGLARQSIVILVDGEQKDLSTTLDTSTTVALITKNMEEALELIRHDAAHIMAQAVKELYPETQVSIGPAIANGFYYDFYREESFTPEDLEKIEARMTEIVGRDDEIIREVWDRDEAIKFFEDQGEKFKAELIADIPAGEDVSLYRQGDFIDLCRGPHLPSTGMLPKAFKLTHVAGAYWRGDSNNPQMQRIYGTAWREKKELKAYIKQIEEAEKRDHRKLGKQMDLFHLQEEAMGSIFWHPRGWRMYQKLESFIRHQMEVADYQEVRTPQLVDHTLWEKSGHWGKFKENMFTTEDEARTYALKPMNCPGAVQIFRQGVKSYRDLPLRFSELNALHRNEQSGALHGILRLRSFHQDDAHTFCREDQVNAETKKFCDFLLDLYAHFGFKDVRVKFSDRPEKRAGTDAVWDKAEAALKEAVDTVGLEYTLNPGEGAFYGPKLEFVLTDAIGRDWQCGTLQVDFILSERLGAQYVGEDGERHYPVILHRAALGSLERFLGILIEDTAGHLPLWLAPVPVMLATVTQAGDDYAKEVWKKLKQAGLHSELDLRNEKIGYKVREHSNAKIPFIWVIGNKEAENNQVAIRKLGQKDTQVVDLDQAIAELVTATTPPVASF